MQQLLLALLKALVELAETHPELISDVVTAIVTATNPPVPKGK